MKCTNCGAELDNKGLFCYNCGAAVKHSGKKCVFCNAELGDDDLFCPECGKSVGITEPAADYANNNTKDNGDDIRESDATPPGKTGSGFLGMDENTQKMLMIAGIGVIVVLLAAALFFGIKTFKGQNVTNTKGIVTKETETSTKETEAPAKPKQTITRAAERSDNPDTASPTTVPAPIFTYAKASSIRGTDSEGGQYSVSSVLSEDKMTKWVPQKGSRGGRNEWIEISSDSMQYVQGIKVLNGYHKDVEVWRNNNRVRRCTITFSNGESMDYTLADTMDLIKIDLGRVVNTTSIRLTIVDIYNGTKWDDTAITYLGAY